MKAVAVFSDKKEIKIIEHPEPNIGTGSQVKLKMLEVGACGTDKEICHFDYGTPPEGSPYLILGHESLGEVVEVGPNVTQFKVGDLAVLVVRRPCQGGDCLPCQMHRQDFCLTGNFKERGIKEAHGFMAEFVVEEEKYLVPVPQNLRPVAVLTEPLTIAEKALKQALTIQERLPHPNKNGKDIAKNALVLGGGPVGLLGAMLFVTHGYKTFVYSEEPSDHLKATLVQKMGATYLSAKNDSIEQVALKIGNIDLVYEATGVPSISFALLKVLGINGIFIFTGVPGSHPPVPIDISLYMRNFVLKNQVVIGTVNAGYENYSDAVRDLGVFIKRWPDVVPALITGRFPLKEESLQSVLLGQVAGIKNVITLTDT